MNINLTPEKIKNNDFLVIFSKMTCVLTWMWDISRILPRKKIPQYSTRWVDDTPCSFEYILLHSWVRTIDSKKNSNGCKNTRMDSFYSPICNRRRYRTSVLGNPPQFYVLKLDFTLEWPQLKPYKRAIFFNQKLEWVFNILWYSILSHKNMYKVEVPYHNQWFRVDWQQIRMHSSAFEGCSWKLAPIRVFLLKISCFA